MPGFPAITKIIIARTLVLLLVFLLGINAVGPYQVRVSAATGPDLIVQGITLSPDNPALEDTVIVTVAVKNQGSTKANTSFVICYVDSNILDTKAIGPLDPGMMTTVTFTWNAEQGSHIIKAIADFSGMVTETDENNNAGTYSITTLAADLIIQSITWLPASPSKGDNIVFTITVKNQGSAKSRYTTVNFYIDGGTRGNQDVPAINPGASVTKTYTWTAVTGQHSLKAVIDEPDNTKESNEANNEYTATFSTLPPDLTVENIAWSPANPSKDDIVSFNITITNQGSGAAGACYLGYYIDDDFLSSILVESLDAGSSCNVSFSWTATTNAHDIRAVIDYFRMVAESNESNNEMKVSLLTLAPDLIISALTWSPADAGVGDTVTFNATLKNMGGGRAEASRAVCYIDGKIAGYLDFPAVAPGAEQIAHLVWVAQSGDHGVSVVADYAGKVVENREDNNKLSTVIPIVPPDLTISEITFLPEKPTIGDTVTFTVTFHNQGGGKASNFKVAYYVDDYLQSIGTVSSLESGVSTNTTCTWIIQNGRHLFKALADFGNGLLEANEENNEDTLPFAPNMPDLSVSNVTWSPPEITPGQEITFDIDIENLGGLDAASSRIAYYVDGVIAGFNDIGPIDSGEKTSRQFIWIASEGLHTLSIIADSKNQVTEIDEVNNTIVVSIPPPDLIVQDITFSPQDAQIGDTIAIAASVINQGGSRTQKSLVTCYIDGISIGSIALPQLDAGESYQSSFDWAAKSGIHTVKIYADISNTVIEVDETNNDEDTIFFTMTPDLVVDGISWLADSQMTSNEVIFTITLKNIGTAPTGIFSMKYSFDDLPVEIQEMPSVPAGTTADYSFIAILSGGEHTVNIFTDIEDDVSELDETNNDRVFSFSTIVPDLIIRSITWAPLDAKIGDTITVTARVENRGREKAVDTRLSLSVDGTPVAFVDIPEIDYDSSATADFSWTAAEGEHEISIMADSDQAIFESNEANNTKNRTISFEKQEAQVKKVAVIADTSPANSGFLDTWWWLFLLVGGLLGLGILVSTIKNLKKK